MPNSERAMWRIAFAKQACSDFAARDQLIRASLPQCHQFHYLQMALEKGAKAHWIDAGIDLRTAQSGHSVLEKVIPMIMQYGLAKAPGKRHPGLIRAVRAFARKIDRLHPSIDSVASPTNCEYPWKDSQGNIRVPAEHDFGIDMNARDKIASKVVKEVRARVMELAGDELNQ